MNLRRALTVAAVCLAAVLGACHASDAAGPAESDISPEQYVDAMVALRHLAHRVQSDSEFLAGKRALMARDGWDDSALVRFARAHADDVVLMSSLWDSVSIRLMRVDSVPPRDTTSAAPGRKSRK